VNYYRFENCEAQPIVSRGKGLEYIKIASMFTVLEKHTVALHPVQRNVLKVATRHGSFAVETPDCLTLTGIRLMLKILPRLNFSTIRHLEGCRFSCINIPSMKGRIVFLRESGIVVFFAQIQSLTSSFHHGVLFSPLLDLKCRFRGENSVRNF